MGDKQSNEKEDSNLTNNPFCNSYTDWISLLFYQKRYDKNTKIAT